jgi:type II secretory pathway pseudopilin PulG
MKKTLPIAAFTLIETLVAILILSVAIVGPLTIASRGLGAALVSKDETIAFYLAQDAVEYIRYKRDSNRLLGLADPLNGLDGAAGCTSTNGCMVDSITDTATACGSTCNAINYNAANFYYSYTSGIQSIFTRKVTIVAPVCAGGGSPCNPDEYSVTSFITWRDVGGAQHAVTVRENLLNWQ